MFRLNPWLLILYNYHWSTNPSSITGNVNGLMVVVDIYADEFAHTACTTNLAEIRHKASRYLGQADNGTVDVDNKSSGRINFCTSDHRNV